MPIILIVSHLSLLHVTRHHVAKGDFQIIYDFPQWPLASTVLVQKPQRNVYFNIPRM